MHVQGVSDGGNWNFVQIHTRCRQGSRVQAVIPAGNASKVNLRLARAQRLIAHARQELGEIIEVTDVVLLEIRTGQNLQTDGNFLQVFRAFLGSYYDFLKWPRITDIRRVRYATAGDQGRGQRHASPFGAIPRKFSPSASSQ